MIVLDPDGNEIGDIAISENARALLERNAELSVHFHTPQLLRFKLGEHVFSFTLRKRNDRIIAEEPETVRRYIRLQVDIRKAMEERDASAAGPG